MHADFILLTRTLLTKWPEPSQHTRTGPVWDLSGLTGWDGRGILQRERHGTRQSTGVSLQRHLPPTRARHSVNLWLRVPYGSRMPCRSTDYFEAVEWYSVDLSHS